MDLEDREAIKEVLYKHCYCVDRIDADEWAALFCEDGSFSIEATPVGGPLGPVTGRAALREFGATAFPAAAGIHSSSNEIISITGDEATASSYCVALLDRPHPRVATAARFEDRLRKVDGRWLISSRRVSLQMVAETDPTTTHLDTRDVVTAFLDDLVRTGGLYLPVKNHAAPMVAWSFPKTTNEHTLHERKDVESWFEIRGKETGGKPDSRFREPPAITVERVVVEGNSAAAQFHAQGETLSGNKYDNRYALMMTIEGGKITEMREFFDTLHVVETFGVDR
jgi:ketosteroid isomerase-like protein